MVSQKYNKLCQNFIFQRRESGAFFISFLSHICVPTEQRKLIFNIRRSSSIRQNSSAILFSKIVHIYKKIWQTQKVMGRKYIFDVFFTFCLVNEHPYDRKTYTSWNTFPHTVHF
jgi:hypothetical protein